MLYDNRNIGRVSVWIAVAGMWRNLTRRHKADLDLKALSPYLKRDLGIGEGVSDFLPGMLHRK